MGFHYSVISEAFTISCDETKVPGVEVASASGKVDDIAILPVWVIWEVSWISGESAVVSSFQMHSLDIHDPGMHGRSTLSWGIAGYFFPSLTLPPALMGTAAYEGKQTSVCTTSNVYARFHCNKGPTTGNETQITRTPSSS